MNTNDALELLYSYEYPSVLTNNDTFLAKSFYYGLKVILKDQF